MIATFHHVFDMRLIVSSSSGNAFLKTVVDQAPQGYEPLPFPSLYWPFPVQGPQTRYIYDAHEIWKFSLYWTLICVGGVHLVAAAYAVAMQYRNWKVIWVIAVMYLVIGGIEGLIAGNVVGGL